MSLFIGPKPKESCMKMHGTKLVTIALVCVMGLFVCKDQFSSDKKDAAKSPKKEKLPVVSSGVGAPPPNANADKKPTADTGAKDLLKDTSNQDRVQADQGNKDETDGSDKGSQVGNTVDNTADNPEDTTTDKTEGAEKVTRTRSDSINKTFQGCSVRKDKCKWWTTKAYYQSYITYNDYNHLDYPFVMKKAGGGQTDYFKIQKVEFIIQESDDGKFLVMRLTTKSSTMSKVCDRFVRLEGLKEEGVLHEDIEFLEFLVQLKNAEGAEIEFEMSCNITNEGEIPSIENGDQKTKLFSILEDLSSDFSVLMFPGLQREI